MIAKDRPAAIVFTPSRQEHRFLDN